MNLVDGNPFYIKKKNQIINMKEENSIRWVIYISVAVAISIVLFNIFSHRKIDTKYCYYQGPNGITDKQVFVGGKEEIKEISKFYKQRMEGLTIFEIDFNAKGTGFVQAFSKVDILKYITSDSSVVKIRYYNDDRRYKKIDARENIAYTLNICLHDTLPQVNE